MRGAVLHGSRDLRFEEQETPTIIKPTDAVARVPERRIPSSTLSQ
jgi:hypothetical protein